MDNLQPGQMLGPYRLIEQIGEGGMATVYKAYQAAMDRYVALKVLPHQLADNPTFIGRFQQEARIIANLEHPHILPVHDYGESQGITYLVMRYLDTGTLKERMSNHLLSLQETDGYFSQLADALEYAHAHGVIHRDLKPSNVLVDARGNLFLTDFGIAKLLESSSQFTGTGALIGTPDYMSPEQAQGVTVDQRSDIYSLGIMLYEMVTGRVPFAAETPLAVILKHLHDPLPLPSSLRPGLSPAIERVLLKALAKSPDDRFATTNEFYEAWNKALAEAGTLKVPVAVQPAATGTPPGPAAATPESAIVAAPPSAGALPAPPAGSASPARPAGRKWSVLATVAGGAVILLLCSLVAVGGLIGALKLPLFSRAPTGVASQPASTPIPPLLPTGTAAAAQPTSGPVRSPLPTDTAAAATPTPTLVPPIRPTPGAPPWKSWVGANHLWSLAIRGDEVAAGGEGLTLWKQSDGSLVRKFGSPADGLPDVFVNAILVGDGGALWIGTAAGVGFYDGTKWTTYGPEDGLDSPTVTALAWLPTGLLAGTQWSDADGQGLNLFTTNGVQHVEGFPSVADDKPGTLSTNITALLVPDPKTWWVGTLRGLARFDGQEKKWTSYFQSDGLPGDTINTLMIDSDGALWAGTNQGAAKFNGQRFEALEHLQGTNVLGIVQDKAGSYWFSGEGGLLHYTPPQSSTALGKWERFTQDNGLPSVNYYGVVKDDNGNLYFGSDGGLVRYDGQAFATWAVPNVPVGASWGRILPAPEGGALWFTDRSGCTPPDRLDLRTETWSLANLPVGCNVLAVGADRSVWLGADDGLWIISADGRQIHLSQNEGLPSDQVVEVAFAAKAAWVGTADHGLALVQDEKIAQTYNLGNAGLTSNVIRVLRAGSDSSMWVGTDKGLDHCLLNGQWEHYTIGHPFAQSLEGIEAIAQAQDGGLWVSTLGEGNVVYRLAQGNWQRFAEGDPGVKLPADFVESLAAAPDGSVWFGSYSRGAARYDGKTWALFGKPDGLVQLHVRDIWVEPTGVVWFATEGGLTRYVP